MKPARLLAPILIAAALVATASPAVASGKGGGGGGGGGTTAPPTPAVQLLPDTTTLSAGDASIAQVLLTPAAPSGGETLRLTSSSAALSVPATSPVAAGIANIQFTYTANNVTAATTATVTVTSPAGSASFVVTVSPAAPAAIGSITVFPKVAASGDPLTIQPWLTGAAPPGGVTVSMHSDSPAVVVPATYFFPAGSNFQPTPITVNAGAVTAVTVVHITASLGGTTVTDQVELHPNRVLTGLDLSLPSVDGALGTAGAATISVPLDGGSFPISLHSSNSAVASVPAVINVANGDAGAGFDITTSKVTTPTDVTITATAGSVTFSAKLTVTPTPPPVFDVSTIAVAPAVVHGPGTATGTLTMTTGAPAGGVVVNLSTSDSKQATVPATVTVPAGATSVTFPIKVLAGNGSSDISIGYTFHNLGRAAPLGVTPAKGGTLLPAGQTQQELEVRKVNDGRYTEGDYGGGVGSIESGQLPPGVSLISNLRPGVFIFFGSPQKAGTYTFVLKFDNNGSVGTLAYVWTVLP